MDHLHRFLFEDLNIRGELVTLTDCYQHVLNHHSDANACVANLLGEILVATALLSSTLKISGHLSLQARGNGALRLLMAECSNELQLRAIARSEGLIESESFRDLIGEGHFCATITPHQGQQYQGIVPLEGDSLASCLEYYFAQSEQLPTRLIIAANGQSAAGLLLQVMPGDQNDHDAWNRLTQLASTLGAHELLHTEHATLINRLFHEETVRLFDPQPLRFGCTCSRERTSQAILAIGEIEARDILQEQGGIELNCQFCGRLYHFSAEEVNDLFEASRRLLH